MPLKNAPNILPGKASTLPKPKRFLSKLAVNATPSPYRQPSKTAQITRNAKAPAKPAKKQPEKKSVAAPENAEKPDAKAEAKPAEKPASSGKPTEAELVKSAKFGEKIVPAAKRPAAPEKKAEPAAKPAPKDKPKRTMPEAETLKKVSFGEKITPNKGNADK